MSHHDTLTQALQQIADWNSHTTEYAVDYGSNGVRDFYRNIARAALSATQPAQAATVVPGGMVLAPHYRGYAVLGIGEYLINHTPAGDPAELVISIASEADKDGRVVGDERDNLPGAMIQPEQMAVRVRFENVAGLDALEGQLRYVRGVHFPGSIKHPAVAQGAGEVAAWQASDGGSSYISNEARSRNSAFRELYTIPLYTQPAAGADVLDALRYRMVRRGQHWSVINGIGDTLRGEDLDAAIDAQL